VDIIERRGYNFRITELQAALGVAQFPKLRDVIRLKRRNEELYRRGLESVEQVSFPFRDPRCYVVPHRVNILVDEPQKLIDYLGKYGIGCRRFYIPMHRQPCYNQQGHFPNSEWAYEHGVVLPSSPTLTEQQIATVCERIKAYYG
jgi:perosamine synthetase